MRSPGGSVLELQLPRRPAYSGNDGNARSFEQGGGFQTTIGTSIACPRVSDLLAALLDKESATGVLYVEGDADMRDWLIEYTLYIVVTGLDDETGLGFFPFLNQNEFDEMFRGVSYRVVSFPDYLVLAQGWHALTVLVLTNLLEPDCDMLRRQWRCNA